MLYNILFYLFICVVSSKVCHCERRITNGNVVATGKKYVVYLVNSPHSQNQPEDWLCGGVIISTLHVLTAAACLTEVSHMYVIAGYKKYISGKHIMDDPCTSTRKQKIVRIIIPKAYNETSWMRFDVGIGVVEKHYDFLDTSYRKVCSYEPEAVVINYDMRFEFAGYSALALGWGAANARQPQKAVENAEHLMETHAIIANSTFCRKQFPQELEYLFLCTYGLHDVEFGEALDKIKKEKEMTSSSTAKRTTHVISSTTTSTSTTTTESELALTETTTTYLNIFQSWRCGSNFSDTNLTEECIDTDSVEVLRRKSLISNGSDTILDEILDKNETYNEADSNHTISRKQGTDVDNYGGICQNDHGGPLVALVGKQEKLIGIALTSVYSNGNECYGPSLYLSTARAAALIKCLLAPQRENYYVPKRCKAMNYEVKKFNVSWPTCEDGGCEITTESIGPKSLEQPVFVPQIQPVSSAPKAQLVSPAPTAQLVSPALTAQLTLPAATIQLISPVPTMQSKTALSTIYNTEQTSKPTHYNMELPYMHHSPPHYFTGMQFPHYTPPSHNMPLLYTYYTSPGYKMFFHDFSRLPYNMGMPYKQNYHMGMPHIPSHLGLPYNSLNYNKRRPYNRQKYNMGLLTTIKRPPYLWS